MTLNETRGHEFWCVKFNLGLHDMMQVDLDNLVLQTPEEQPSAL